MFRKSLIFAAAVTLAAAACHNASNDDSTLNASVALPAGLKRLAAVDGDVILTVTTGSKGGMKITTVNPVADLGNQTKESINDFCAALTFAGETGWAPLTYGEAHTLETLKLKLVPGYQSDVWISSEPGWYHLFSISKDDIIASFDLIPSARSAPAGVMCAKDAGSAAVAPPAADIMKCSFAANGPDAQVTLHQENFTYTAHVEKGSLDETLACEKTGDSGAFSNTFHNFDQSLLVCSPEGNSGVQSVKFSYRVSPMPHSTAAYRRVEASVDLGGSILGNPRLICETDLSLLDTWND